LAAILATAWERLKENDFSEAAFELFVAQPVNYFCDYNFATKVRFNSDIKFKFQVLIADKLNPVSWYQKFTKSDTTSATFLADEYIKAER
jgi:hypothetical protein